MSFSRTPFIWVDTVAGVDVVLKHNAASNKLSELAVSVPLQAYHRLNISARYQTFSRRSLENCGITLVSSPHLNIEVKWQLNSCQLDFVFPFNTQRISDLAIHLASNLVISFHTASTRKKHGT